ncbi:GNAT family N-acetyltransferase [Ferrimonas senticii]|uniref:GNAT family N-acetyltransferase n=1 Tax=Ferrimonas senticii TaxID=394566 RepID=UPI00040BAB73|nr:GNAT family N-acetyltransferase [Ferrimonas senticii]
MDIVVRRSTVADADAIVALYSHGNAQMNTLQMPFAEPNRWRERLSNQPSNVFSLVAEVDGELVGSIGLTISECHRRRHVGDFGMGVKDSHQGLGIGQALLSAMIDLADNWLDLHRIELTVFSDNHRAQHLYQKFGFVTEGELRDYAFRNGQYADALSMARINPNH